MNNILVIDDDEINLEFSEAMLMGMGYNVIKANSVMEAFEIINKEHIILILCDLMMPDGGGFELLKSIKKNEVFKDIPVIVVSGHKYEDKITLTTELGGLDYIRKPINVSDFIEKIDPIIKPVQGIYLFNEIKLVNDLIKRKDVDSINDELIINKIKRLKAIIYILKSSEDNHFRQEFIENIYISILEFETKFDRKYFESDANQLLSKELLIDLSNDEKVDAWIRHIAWAHMQKLKE